MFIQEYLRDQNATQAATRAGYRGGTHHGAKQSAHRLMQNPEIKAMIDAKLQKKAERLELQADNIIKELGLLGFSNMLDYISPQGDGTAFVDLSKLTREQAAAIQEVTVDSYTDGKGEDAREVKRVKFKLADKRGPLVDLGKFVHRWSEKHEHKIDDIQSMTDEQLTALASRLGLAAIRVTSGGTA